MNANKYELSKECSLPTTTTTLPLIKVSLALIKSFCFQLNLDIHCNL